MADVTFGVVSIIKNANITIGGNDLKKNKVILIYEANENELPVTIVKNPVEASQWLGCSRKTIYNMLKSHTSFNGYALEIILL